MCSCQHPLAVKQGPSAEEAGRVGSLSPQESNPRILINLRTIWDEIFLRDRITSVSTPPTTLLVFFTPHSETKLVEIFDLESSLSSTHHSCSQDNSDNSYLLLQPEIMLVLAIVSNN